MDGDNVVLHLELQTVVLNLEIHPGRCNIKCNSFSSVEWHLKGRSSQKQN